MPPSADEKSFERRHILFVVEHSFFFSLVIVIDSVNIIYILYTTLIYTYVYIQYSIYFCFVRIKLMLFIFYILYTNTFF